MLSNSVLRKFESYMMGKNGGLVSAEKPCAFWSLKNEKTLENPGFFGQVSFLLCQYGRVEQKRYRTGTQGTVPCVLRTVERVDTGFKRRNCSLAKQ